MKNSKQAPWEQLSREKKELYRQCRQTEKDITQDWQYIRLHAGGWLLSELTTALTSSAKERKGTENDGLSSGQWTRMVWQLLRPIAERWIGDIGWQVFKSMYKKKNSSKNRV